MNILAIIPARAGSKGLPDKNIKQLQGKPLIAHTIEAALHSANITRTVVSTDSKHYARIAKAYGAEVPFIRPKMIAGDHSTMVEVIRHTVNWIIVNENTQPDAFILLQPTCPLRTTKHIDEAISIYLQEQTNAVISVCEVNEHPYTMQEIRQGRLYEYVEITKKPTRRQEYPPLYRLNGCIYMCQTAQFLIQRTFHLAETMPYVMSKRDSIDIDTALDFRLASLIMEKDDLK